MLYRLETNVTGSQSSTVAVKGDIVNFTCEILFHGKTNPTLMWASNPECPVAIPPIRSKKQFRATISWEELKRSVRIRQRSAAVFCTCEVNDLPNDYFWQSSVITVSCEYKTLPTAQERSRPGGENTTILYSAEAIALTITVSQVREFGARGTVNL